MKVNQNEKIEELPLKVYQAVNIGHRGWQGVPCEDNTGKEVVLESK